MKTINLLSKILVLTLVMFCLLASTNSISAQNTSPLCFTARNGSVTVRFDIKNVTHTIQYSTNGTTWSTYTSNSNVTIAANQSIYFRAATNQTAANPFGSSSTNTCSRFYFTSANGGTVEGSGNIMSLYGPACPDLPLSRNAFNSMFESCTLLTTAPDLPATTLARSCYGCMFYGCTALTAAPALPATTLAADCYFSMFCNCTSLTAAPALPATTLAPSCYSYMFIGCSSLTTAPALPATVLAMSCYNSMFSGCSSLTAAPALSATTLATGCYSGMFLGCTSLTIPPSLPATTLAVSCYSYMFASCRSLTAAPALPATNLTSTCYRSMFSNCSTLTVAPDLPATTLARSCYGCMFYGCTALTAAPALPATTLAIICYGYMFSGCTSITTPPSLPATTLADQCYYNMFENCTSMVVNATGPGITWSIPAPVSATDALTGMFIGTGGTINGTPSVLTTYYIRSGGCVATANINNSAMGSTSGTGFYMRGDTVTMTATPNAHHHFVNWSNGAATPVISFVIYKDTTFTAIFAANPTYLFADSATICPGDSYTWRNRNLTAAGVYYDSLTTVLGEDSIHKLTLNVGHEYLIEDSATVCKGYPWHGKYITKAGIYYDSLTTVSGCDSVYKLTVTINRHNVTLNTNDSTIGTVSGIGTYECGEKVQITATAIDSCHSFANWSDGNTTNPRTFVITSDTSFTAIFKKNVYTVTVSPNKANAGVAYCITNTGKDTTVTVECGETVNIHAESRGQYHFTGWSDGGTDSVRVITVTSDTNLIALFKAHCGDMTHWPVEFKFNNLIMINLNALNAEGYYPEDDRVAWYMAVGDVDAVEEVFPVDDQFVCNGYYMSLIANGLSGGRYYAVIDAIDIGTPCVGAMKSEVVEYIPAVQGVRMDVAPTSVRNGDQVTLSGLNAAEVSTVRVYDYTGKLIQTIETSGTDRCQIPTTGCAGVYTLNVTSDTANETFRFIVTK